MKVIQEAYPGRVAFSEDSIKVWSAALADLPTEETKLAVDRLVKASRFPPSIAEIRQAVAELVDPIPSAEDAYHEARMIAQRFSPYSKETPPYSHPLIRRAVEIIGIDTMAYTTDPQYIGRQFRDVYQRLRDQEITRRQTGQALPLTTRERLVLMAGEVAIQ